MMSLDVLVVGTNFVDEYEVEGGEVSASRHLNLCCIYWYQQINLIDLTKATILIVMLVFHKTEIYSWNNHRILN